MWRAMIVDDEPIIRFGIKASVDWTGEGIEIAADCANGAEALQRLEREPIDILITDIKMPIMDGLDLTRRALAINPGMKVILVSSHNDFEYVREGIKLGVVDYILKHTLEPEELLEIVRKCKETLEEERRMRSRLNGADREKAALLRKRYEGELKLHLIQRTERLPAGEYPAWLDDAYVALHIKLNRISAIEEQHGYLYKSVLLEQFADALYAEVPEGIAVQTAENELFFLMPGPKDNSGPQAGPPMVERLRGLKGLLELDGGTSVTFGYAVGRGADEIRAVFVRSQEASDRGFFEGSGIFAYDASAAIRREGKHLPTMYQTAAAAGDERVGELLEEWRADWSQGGRSPIALKEEASRVLSLMFKRHVDPYALVDCFDRLFKTETLDELCETLKLSIAELRKARLESFDAQGTGHPIDKALDYIRAHYLETLTLQQVADFVHVSKNYFSILFKKVTGQNFIDYVITLRIQKAKELLAGTELKVYEVAEQSGFNDVKYFSKLFKKMTGHSPVDYRERHPHRTTGGGTLKGESAP